MKEQNLYIKLRRLITGSVLTSFLLFAACDSSNALLEGNSDEALAPSVANLSGKLSLTPAQSQELNQVLDKRGEQDPGTLWYLAGALQQTLSTDQKAELLEGIVKAEPRRRAQGVRPWVSMQRNSGQIDEILGDLTDAQKEQLKALHEKRRAEVQAMMGQHREEGLSREAIREAREGIQSEMKEVLASILTAEQLATLEAHRSEAASERREGRQTRFTQGRKERTGRRGSAFDGVRDELSAARIDVLGLTEAQQSQLKELREAQREKAGAFFEALEEGDLEREVVREKVDAFRAASKTTMEEVLTSDQIEVIEIHRALMSEVMQARVRKGGARSGAGFKRFNKRGQ